MKKQAVQEQYKVVSAVQAQIQHEKYRISQQTKHLEGLWIRLRQEEDRLAEMLSG